MQVWDDLGKEITIESPPKRIVSLVPSQTETLSDLGLDSEVLGITKFCVHPEPWLQEKTLIGGTKNPNIEKIRQLKPDLVIANKEENLKNHVQEIEEFAPVYTTDVSDYKSALKMILNLGILTGKEAEAKEWNQKIQDKFKNKASQLGSAIYLIWANPYLSVGGDTFINSMLQKYGFQNLLQDENRYPEISKEAIIDLKPDYLLLSSEPYPFASKHLLEWKSILPQTEVFLVDGEKFSWYGTRMGKYD
mgnify:CR=1 FL=1